MKFLIKKLFYLVFLVPHFYVNGCTDFILMAEDKSAVVGRSLEFAASLQSEVIFQPANRQYSSRIADNKIGMTWKGKYAYLGLNAFGMDIITDGMNEKGLSIGLLWFPGASYPTISSSNKKKILALEDFGSWILSSFATIKEVKKAVQDVQIWAHVLPPLKGIPPVHFSLHDRSGKSLVIEFINKAMEVSDNPVGVLTNAPKLQWHLTNLRNYINLSAINVQPITFDGTVLDPTGQGTGLLGIPGDWTPPSRFVRISLFKDFVQKGKNAEESVIQAFHLLNTVDIPYGAVRGSKEKDFDYTQWIVVKDLSRGTLYWRTYKDLDIQSIDFAHFKSKAERPQKIPMERIFVKDH